jgi:hypothetical protein
MNNPLQTISVRTLAATVRGMGRLFALAAVVTTLALAGTAVAAKRPAAPAVSGITLEGKSLSIARFKGRPVLLNVWSSW